jgi:hypothetical protein
LQLHVARRLQPSVSIAAEIGARPNPSRDTDLQTALAWRSCVGLRFADRSGDRVYLVLVDAERGGCKVVFEVTLQTPMCRILPSVWRSLRAPIDSGPLAPAVDGDPGFNDLQVPSTT